MVGEESIFMWYDSSDNRPVYGPYYYSDVEKIEKKLYHRLGELLLMNISDTLKKRLNGARIGTSIKIHYWHSNGDMMVKRITREQVDLLDKLTDLNAELSKIALETKVLKEDQMEIVNQLEI